MIDGLRGREITGRKSVIKTGWQKRRQQWNKKKTTGIRVPAVFV